MLRRLMDRGLVAPGVRSITVSAPSSIRGKARRAGEARKERSSTNCWRLGLRRRRANKTELSGSKSQGCPAEEVAAVSIDRIEHPVRGDCLLASADIRR
jgi:hypothetical protein